MVTRAMILYNDNWADEMDLCGFAIVPTNVLEAFKEMLELRFKHSQGVLVWHVGTNEEIEFEDVEDFWNRFTISYIQGEDAFVITNSLQIKPYISYPTGNSYVYGFMPFYLAPSVLAEEEHEVEVDEEEGNEGYESVIPDDEYKLVMQKYGLDY